MGQARQVFWQNQQKAWLLLQVAYGQGAYFKKFIFETNIRSDIISLTLFAYVHISRETPLS